MIPFMLSVVSSTRTTVLSDSDSVLSSFTFSFFWCKNVPLYAKYRYKDLS